MQAALVVGLLLPLLAGAQGSGIQQTTSPPQGTNFSINSLLQFLNTVVSWLFTIFLIIAVIYIIIAAFKYLTSGGDPTKVQDATRAVIYAAVAIAVALLSVAIRSFVTSILQQGAGLQ
jgi:heme/copper-type cytochrome/quinol oxidase subunit 2